MTEIMLTELSDRFGRIPHQWGARAGTAVGGDQPAVVVAAGRCIRTAFAEEAEVFVQQLSEQPDYRLLIDVR